MMKIENTCFFTGHRKLNNTQRIITLTEEQIILMIQNGIDTFLTGGAVGFDTMCADIVCRLRDTSFPAIKLMLYLPCYGYGEKWTDEQRYHAGLLRYKADEKRFISEEPFTPGCMKKRNYQLVNDALYGIAYYERTRSGTGQTIRYAQKTGRKIINIAGK